MTGKSVSERNPMSRQAERKAAHRAAILDAAEQLLAAAGSVVSVEEIAERAGVAKGTVYNHFANKDAVLRAVARQVREAAAAEVAAAVDGISDSRARLAAGIGVYLALARDDPDRGAILVRIIGEAVDPSAPLNAALLAELNRGNQRGELDAHPPRAAALFVLATVQAAMTMMIDRPGRPADHAAGRALTGFAIRALSAR